MAGKPRHAEGISSRMARYSKDAAGMAGFAVYAAILFAINVGKTIVVENALGAALAALLFVLLSWVFAGVARRRREADAAMRPLLLWVGHMRPEDAQRLRDQLEELYLGPERLSRASWPLAPPPYRWSQADRDVTYAATLAALEKEMRIAHRADRHLV